MKHDPFSSMICPFKCPFRSGIFQPTMFDYQRVTPQLSLNRRSYPIIPIVMVSFTRQEKTYIPLYPRLYPHDIPIMIVKSPLVLKSTIISESLVLCWGLLGWLRWDPATARPWYLCWVIACAADHGDVLPAACLTTKWKTAWGPALGRLQQKRHETSDMLECSPRVG